MNTQYDIITNWPWTIEYRHRQSKRKVLFVIPQNEVSGNGLRLLQATLGNKEDYYAPRGVHIVSELLGRTDAGREQSEMLLICPTYWFHEIVDEATDRIYLDDEELYRLCSPNDLEKLTNMIRTRYNNAGKDPVTSFLSNGSLP